MASKDLGRATTFGAAEISEGKSVKKPGQIELGMKLKID